MHGQWQHVGQALYGVSNLIPASRPYFVMLKKELIMSNSRRDNKIEASEKLPSTAWTNTTDAPIKLNQ